MEDDRISACGLKRERADIALTQFNRSAIEFGARKPEHFGASVNASSVGCRACEEREHPPGASANINQTPNRRVIKRARECRLNLILRHMK